MRVAIFTVFFVFSTLFASMEYFQGEGEELLLGKEGKIQLLTWNILGLPNHLVAVRPWEERIDGIAALILSSDADVVILQECFEKELSVGLYERLKEKYAHSYLHLEEEKTPLPSGLALFSKLPIDQARFTPHPDLLDGEQNSKMGILDFLVLNKEKKPIAHIAGSHFQGSSNCEWRVGLTEDGQRLSYVEVRDQETKAALDLLSEEIPSYLCGDLNVDRRSAEFYSSFLNSEMNADLVDPMTPAMQIQGTNTNFWKHAAGLARMYPSLSQKEILALTQSYKKLYEEKLIACLAKEPWQKPLSQFDPSYFSLLEKELNLSLPHEKMIWKYFKVSTFMAIAKEKELWRKNKNQGEAPLVPIGRLLQVSVLPIEESLDFILGTNSLAVVENMEILQGYDDASSEKTLSDHHPVKATLRVAE